MSALGFVQDMDYLINSDKFNDRSSQSMLFLEFYNTQVDQKLRFKKSEIFFFSKIALKDVFVIKICSMLGIVPIPYNNNQSKKENYNQNIQFNVKLNSFLSAVRIPKQYFKIDIDIKNALRLIDLIDGKNLNFRLDANDAFKKFILNKLLKDQKTRYIEHSHNSISIIPSYEEPLMIYPFWELVANNQPLIDEHIKRAVDCIRKSEFKQVYLVYPKNENFEKHIEVKIKEFEESHTCSEYKVKVIPYSLRSILRN